MQKMKSWFFPQVSFQKTNKTCSEKSIVRLAFAIRFQKNKDSTKNYSKKLKRAKKIVRRMSLIKFVFFVNVRTMPKENLRQEGAKHSLCLILSLIVCISMRIWSNFSKFLTNRISNDGKIWSFQKIWFRRRYFVKRQ